MGPIGKVYSRSYLHCTKGIYSIIKAFFFSLGEWSRFIWVLTLTLWTPPWPRVPEHLFLEVSLSGREITSARNSPLQVIKLFCLLRENSATKWELPNLCLFYCFVGRLTCVDIAEVNPSLGNERDNLITVNSALSIITHCFGGRRQGTYPKNYQIPIPTHTNHVAPPPS